MRKVTEVAEAKFADGKWLSLRWADDLEAKAQEVEDEIINRTADGDKLKSICKDRGWPFSIVWDWINDDARIAARFNAALSACGLNWAQEAIEIVDAVEFATEPHHVTAAKIRSDLRARMAGRLDRQRFGETPNLQINAQAGSLVSILSALPPVRAPEEIDVTAVEEKDD